MLKGNYCCHTPVWQHYSGFVVRCCKLHFSIKKSCDNEYECWHPFHKDLVNLSLEPFFRACTQSGSSQCSSIMRNLFFSPPIPQAKNKHPICHSGCVEPSQSVHLRTMRRGSRIVGVTALSTSFTMCWIVNPGLWMPVCVLSVLSLADLWSYSPAAGPAVD